MMRMDAGWQPIETAPEEGEFLAERQTTGDWLKVVRYSGLKGVSSEVNVVHLTTGLLWSPKRWMPLPTPPHRRTAPVSEREYKAHVAAVNKATDAEMAKAMGEREDKSHWYIGPTESYRISTKASYEAGREAGMREAAGINQDLARKYHGVGQEAWATVLCDGAAAILSVIGEPKT